MKRSNYHEAEVGRFKTTTTVLKTDVAHVSLLLSRIVTVCISHSDVHLPEWSLCHVDIFLWVILSSQSGLFKLWKDNVNWFVTHCAAAFIISSQGWMNETYSYDPETFHPSITHSVHVTLEGSRLQLRHPRANIPRWATFKETPCEAAFLRSRAYQLANSKVSVYARNVGSQQNSHTPQIEVRERQRERRGELWPDLITLISPHPTCHPTRRWKTRVITTEVMMLWINLTPQASSGVTE